MSITGKIVILSPVPLIFFREDARLVNVCNDDTTQLYYILIFCTPRHEILSLSTLLKISYGSFKVDLNIYIYIYRKDFCNVVNFTDVVIYPNSKPHFTPGHFE